MEAKTDALNTLSQFHLLSFPSEEIVQCPSCEAKIKRFEVAEHYEKEMELFRKMKSKAIKELEETETETSSTEERKRPWNVFQKVQKNRQTRLRQRTRRRPASPLERLCPICSKSFPQDEIETHAEQCLNQSNGNNNGSDENSSDDGGEEYEEYEWAGQKRIRVSSLLQGGYAAIGVGQQITNRQAGQEDEDEDLNVDEDDSHIYGPPQYSEQDVITCENEGNNAEGSDRDDSNVTNYVRRLIMENSNCPKPTTSSSARQDEPNSNSIERRQGVESEPTSENCVTLNPSSSNATDNQTIEALKVKLRHYEKQALNKYKCLICLDDYKNPAISVACWHVHCEQCWLRSLGARKLCPQCNLITSPKDLRRIYM